MKHTLFLPILLITGTALGQELTPDAVARTTELPAGTSKTYNLNLYVSSYSVHGYTNYAETIHFCDDGKTVFFQDLSPAEGCSAWVKGEYIDDRTIRVFPQDYGGDWYDATVDTEGVNVVMWYGKKAGQQRAQYYDFIVDGETIRYADADAWVSLYDEVQGGAYEFDSELVFTPLGEAPSTDMITEQPAGECRRYFMEANVYDEEDNDYWAKFSMRVDVVFPDDEDAVYFSTLTPDYTNTSWVRGTLDRETGLISVAPYQAIEALPGYDVYTYLCHYDRNTGGYLDTPVEFILDDDGTISALDEEATLCAIYMQGAVRKSICALNYSQTLYPVDKEPVTLPADAVARSYVMNYTDYNRAQQSRVIGVAFCGQEVFFQGLNQEMPEQWVRGLLDGDRITLPSWQLYASDDPEMYQYHLFQGGHWVRSDGYPQGVDAITLSYDPATLSISGGDDDYIIISYLNRINYQLDYYNSISMRLKSDWTPASPANPSFDVECHLDADDPYFVFYVPNVDVNGDYLNPDQLYYSLYFDGELFTFTPDDYIYLGTSATMIPYAYYDNYDFSALGSRHVLYIHYPYQYDWISLQSVYIHEGKEYRSEQVTRNYGPYIPPSPEGIEEITATPASRIFYNLYGQRVASSQHGICILPGKKTCFR